MTTCTVPPEGWTCSRPAGHPGPCAARPSAQSVIEEAAQVLESAAAHNRSKGRTVLERTQQDRADRLRAILVTPVALDADETLRLRRLMKALGYDDAFEQPAEYVRGILFTLLGQAAGKLELAALPTYTCKGKGGEYTLVGVAYGAGSSRGATMNIYRDVATGGLYFRTPNDFEVRMQRVSE